MSDPAATQRRLVEALCDPGIYPHPVATVELRETHISFVLLAGDYAYKIKKPLDLGFLDFSTLAARAHYCAEEIRLNGRLAPGMYRDVVTITGTPAAPVLGDDGPAIEYAVRMRRFDDGRRLDHELQAGRLRVTEVETIASDIADFHEHQAASIPPADCGTPDAVLQPIHDNFPPIRSALTDADECARLDRLQTWISEQGARLRPVFAERRARGRVRECHGDLHLGNMVRLGDELAIFDGIEFNASLRWVDVASDIAFFVMDLDRQGAPALAGRVLDTWLAQTGDYAALDVIRLYLVYRALVRAKISAIRAGQTSVADESAPALADARAHLELAERYAAAWAPAVVLTHGVSGTGKSTAGTQLVERIGAIRLRSDVERRRLYPDPDPDIRYSKAASDAVFAHLAELTWAATQAGWPVVVDATFIQRARRRPFVDLARDNGLPLHILELRLPPAERDRRISARLEAGDDASEADSGIARAQEQALEPFTAAEQRYVIRVDNSGPAPLVPATGLRHGRGELAPES